MQCFHDVPRFSRAVAVPATQPPKHDPGRDAEPDERQPGAPQADPHELPDLPEPAEVGEDG
ncbi:hypothetical protein [Paraburkholderia lycopersici]|uniref:Uncharacterized protein n=1 Tax=Paraburkholderia lycopersici TaxID=416944 RepID=A0A1G7ASW6_9BURK|nr:hypothetical protein [Paraburkholderia lycopersici]SDE17881.1 hypothetical protein SAMN05421548_13562 [Paraburkholderia lycopersici]